MDAPSTIATRHSLLTRLKNWEDHESWRQFFDTYWRLIYHVALRAGLNESEAQDVVQETVVEIASRIKDFKCDKSRGSFSAWLLQLTRWRITDQFRKRRPQAYQDTASGTGLMERVPDPNSVELDQCWEKDWRENITVVALEHLRKNVPAKQYQVFDLFVTRHWSATDVAKTLRISVAQVYLIKFRLLKVLKAEVKRLEREFI